MKASQGPRGSSCAKQGILGGTGHAGRGRACWKPRECWEAHSMLGGVFTLIIASDPTLLLTPSGPSLDYCIYPGVEFTPAPV
jgi:hypothetical protein